MTAALLAVSIMLGSLTGSAMSESQKLSDSANHHRWHVARIAPFYGPGFYGKRTACGIRLGHHTRGVASRTMRCGQRLTLRWHGNVTRVRVIDRGPYPPHRLYTAMPFDLAPGTACHDLHGGHNGYGHYPKGGCYTLRAVSWHLGW